MEIKNQIPRRGRLSRFPAVLIILFSAALIGLAWFAVDSRAQDNEPTEKIVFDEGLGRASDEIARLQRESQKLISPEIKPAVKLIPEPVKERPLPEILEPKRAPLSDYERYRKTGSEPDAAALYQKRIQEQRQTALFKALSASSGVDLKLAGSTGSRAGSLALTGADLDSRVSSEQSSRLRDLQREELSRSLASLGGLSGMSGAVGTAGSFVERDKTLSAYQSLDQGTDFAHPYRPQAQDTPYLIHQGAVIPAVLISGINSDLPGMVIAQVIENVYDSTLGNHLLIPEGSRLIGQYGSSPKLGQERVMLGFNRVIFPDGASLTLGSMPGAAMDGYAGFDAEVDNHLFRLVTNAVLLGGITASVTMSQDDDDDDGDYGSALSESLGVSLGTALSRVIEQNMNVSPTLKVAPGYTFNVVVAKDLRFDGPYRGPFRGGM